MSNPVEIHTVVVNDHIVCASPSERVTHLVLRVCEGMSDLFPAYEDRYGRRRYGLPVSYIKTERLAFGELAPYVNYRVPVQFKLKPVSEGPLVPSDYKPDPVYQVQVTTSVARALEELGRTIRENLQLSI